MKNRKIAYSCATLICSSLIALAPVSAQSTQTLCIKKKLKIKKSKARNGSALRVIEGSDCPKGFKAVVDTSIFKGVDGAAGAAGAAGMDGAAGLNGLDGDIRVYGDGSAGSLSIAANTTLTDSNTMYENIVVLPGATLTVASGTVLRATGTVTIEGFIEVNPASIGGIQESTPDASATLDGPHTSPHPGISFRLASNGELGDNAQDLQGGLGGIGIGADVARNLTKISLYGGGGAGVGVSSNGGASGGGSLAIYSAGAFVNNGLISAVGEDGTNVGSGGGGGGVVVVASDTSIDNSAGLIDVSGGSGRNPASAGGAGGGGAGGLVHLLAPSVDADAATADVTAGAGGAAAPLGTVSNGGFKVSGGGGGGASVGDGGSGGSVSSNGAAGGGSAATNGVLITTEVSPTPLL